MKSDPDDAEAGVRGLQACSKELEKYKYCMDNSKTVKAKLEKARYRVQEEYRSCLLYTSPSPRDKRQSRMPSSA